MVNDSGVVRGTDSVFVTQQEDPQSRYTFDSEKRDAPEVEICREGDKLSRKCIQASRATLVLNNGWDASAHPGNGPIGSYAFDEDVPSNAGAYAASRTERGVAH